MNEQSVFHLIRKITHQKNVACVLIGGFAVNHYKVTRQTVDVDFLIVKEDFEKVQSALKDAGYRQSSVQENFTQLESARLSLRNIDFMFVDRSTLDKIIKKAQPLTIAGQKFLVPSLNHLIALKLHSIKNNEKLRLLKDLPDIVSLIRKNEVNVESKEFKDLCLKYGTEGLYQKICEAIK
ncbi:MAG: nucleotidyl transferase AbiEii/AbiGii toxin family protein [Candidatus Omnitrophota bacterium]